MQGIEIKWDDVSDSKEYYSSRPKPIMSLFVYFILLLILTAIVYIFIGKIEIASVGNGSIRPNSKISTVSNLVGGKISELTYKDGQFVKAGETLIVLENTYDIQINMIDEKIERLKSKNEMIEKYIESIKLQENKFSDNINGVEYEYYVRFSALQNNVKSVSNDDIAELKGLNVSIEGLETTINNLQNEVEMLLLLKQSIEQETDLLKDNPKYQYIYQQYLLDLEVLKSNYNQALETIDENDNMYVLRNTLKNLEVSLENYKIFAKSIEERHNYFSLDNPFISNYQEYEALYNQYSLSIKQAEKTYEILIQDQTEELDIQSEDARLQIDIAKEVLYAFVSKSKTQTASSISSIEEQIESTKLKINNVAINSDKKESANDDYALSIKKIFLNNKISIEAELIIKREELDNLKNTLESTYIALELYQMNTLENGESLTVSSLWLNALIDSYTLLSVNKTELDALNLQRMEIQEHSNLHMITAQINGIINVMTELNTGDMINTGTQIATILPDGESEYRVLLYVDSKDIVGIEAGSSVKFEIPALPSQIYGDIYGQVVSVSRDTKSINNQQTKYYLIECLIDNRKLYDKNGKEANIEVGMIIEGRIIVSKIRIIDYILQNLNFN